MALDMSALQNLVIIYAMYMYITPAEYDVLKFVLGSNNLFLLSAVLNLFNCYLTSLILSSSVFILTSSVMKGTSISSENISW